MDQGVPIFRATTDKARCGMLMSSSEQRPLRIWNEICTQITQILKEFQPQQTWCVSHASWSHGQGQSWQRQIWQEQVGRAQQLGIKSSRSSRRFDEVWGLPCFFDFELGRGKGKPSFRREDWRWSCQVLKDHLEELED